MQSLLSNVLGSLHHRMYIKRNVVARHNFTCCISNSRLLLLQSMKLCSKRSTELSDCTPSKVRRRCHIKEPTESEMNSYECLDGAKKKPAILKIIQLYANSFVPKVLLAQLPKPISSFYNPDVLKMNYTELLAECERLFNMILVIEIHFSIYMYAYILIFNYSGNSRTSCNFRT